MANIKEHAESVLARYRIAEKPLYIVGTFDSGVTVFSQQVRALNLVWALVESEQMPCLVPDKPPAADSTLKIAIVGGGFTGLSVAAGLMKKNADAKITIFEARDTLLPLQQGSDSRWLHPRIYDWPGEGSEASVAMLPVLNWSAARASDVVVQILTEWGKVVADWETSPGGGTDAADRWKPKLFCNARHLQIHETRGNSKRLQIEWVGERRDVKDATILKGEQRAALGASEDFDLVILTVGFGLERDGATSYWRNEGLGQPSLDQPRRTYVVSGQGDGAMIDLLRLRVSQYRQDRILEELFRNKDKLFKAVKDLYLTYSADNDRDGLFNDFESLADNAECGFEFEAVCESLARRLRRDTEVILRLKVRKLSELFDFSQTRTRISFQNKLLVYFVYKCGGFFPSSLEEPLLLEQHSVIKEGVVRRHGTLRDELIKNIISDKLYDAILKRRGRDVPAVPDPFTQSAKLEWSGGFFGSLVLQKMRTR